MASLPLYPATIRQPSFLYGSDGRFLAANDLAEAMVRRTLAGCSVGDIVRLCHVRHPDGTPFTPDRLPA